MMDAEFFVFKDLSWQTIPPPARYPVPVRYAGDLAIGDEVTIGVPGRYFIDHQVLLRTDPQLVAHAADSEPQESLAVCAPIYYWTWQADPKRNPLMQWWPLDRMWIYRDAAPPSGEAPEPSADETEHSWLDRVRPDASAPPVLHAVPAREAGSLTGRRLRVRNAAGEWFWFVGVSEPHDVNGDICVQAVPACHWYLHQLSYYEELQPKIRTLALHRLFSYS